MVYRTFPGTHGIAGYEVRAECFSLRRVFPLSISWDCRMRRSGAPGTGAGSGEKLRRPLPCQPDYGQPGPAAEEGQGTRMICPFFVGILAASGELPPSAGRRRVFG